MKKSILLLSFILFCQLSFPQEKEKFVKGSEPVLINEPPKTVLFIGNSLTYFHDMPGILQKMLEFANLNFKVTQSAYPGQSLKGHIDYVSDSLPEVGKFSRPKEGNEISVTEKILNSGKWNYVVLQEGTVRLLIPEVKIHEVIPSINKIKSKAEGAEFVLYKTWPDKDPFPKQFCYPKTSLNISSPKNKYCSPTMNSLEDEVNLINAGYDTVALATNIKTVPTTECFLACMKKYSKMDLYDDSCHPSKYGSYLNACVFFKYITKQKASAIRYSGEITEAEAKSIQTLVDEKYP